MKKKMKLDSIDNYPEAPKDMDFDMESIRIIRDLLPPPERLVSKKAKKVKVTIDLIESDVNFFKDEAKRLDVSYQAMIKSLLGHYVSIAQRLRKKHKVEQGKEAKTAHGINERIFTKMNKNQKIKSAKSNR